MSKIIRISLSSLLFIFSIYLFIIGSIGTGILILLLSGLVLLSVFKNEMNMLAFLFLRRNNLNRAKSILNRVKRPENMIKSQEAYFYYLNGLLDAQKGLAKESEKSFRKAISIGLRMKQDQAVAKLNIAAAAASKRNKPEATRLLQEAKKLDTYKMLTEQIKMLEMQLKKI